MHAYCKHAIFGASGFSLAQDIEIVCVVVKPHFTNCSLCAHATVWVAQLGRGQVSEHAQGV